MRGSGTKNFSFDKLLKSGTSQTLQNYSLTVEYTSNPAWYAVQALPYLMEYPYECAEQTGTGIMPTPWQVSLLIHHQRSNRFLNNGK
jgi:uncharacterized protein YfaS (alpha-2-macroglobulin family)